MARRKAAQKSGKYIARKFVHAPKFPADRLPPELIHMVFTHLRPAEAATFRWAGRVVAEIGLQYLAPTVYLKLNEESYDRLLAIAEHPVVSKHVLRLNYETETEGLDSINREQFDQMVRNTVVLPQQYDFSKRPDSLASARTWRAYERDPTVPGRKHYVAKIKEFFPTCYVSYPTTRGLDATIPVTLAAESASLHVDGFCCQAFSWQIFRHSEENLAALKRSMLHLKTMGVAFTNTPDICQDRMVQEMEYILGECLLKGHMVDLITSAPDLEHLGLTFKSSAQFTILPRITATIGNFYWSSLKSVSLDSLQTSDDDLVGFCKRHAHTLKDLSLRNMQLYQGLWDVTLHKMRRVFKLGQQLDSCKLSGLFEGLQGPQWYSYHMDDPWGEDNVDPADIVTSNYIRATNVGDISLDDYHKAMGLK